MNNKQNDQKKAGCLAYVVGGMSFIPLIGVLFGIISIIWGFFIKNTKLKVVGVSGIAFTIIIYGALGYFGLVQKGGVYDELRGKLTKTQLTSAVQAIEFYKVQNGYYPESLEVLQKTLPDNSMVFLHDAAQVNAEDNLYYYKLIDKDLYHIRSYGRDGIINTADDILPSEIKNTGLVVDYQVLVGL